MGGPGGERATTSDTMMQLGRDGAGLLFHVGGVVRPRRQKLVGLLQPNVKLVDINETPIERITPTGIKTSDADYEFDIIIYATVSTRSLAVSTASTSAESTVCR
jgi:hypothetical protein